MTLETRVQVIDTINNQKNGKKDFSDSTIRYDRDQVEDIMTGNDIMNHMHQID